MKALPFYWGFDIGLEMPADDVYKMLTIIDKHADELAKLDPSFTQIGGGNMAAFQKRALEATWDSSPSIRALPNTCEKRACGTRSGIPRSPRCRA